MSACHTQALCSVDAVVGAELLPTTITQCTNLWPEQHFSTTSLQNNAKDRVTKTKQKNIFLCTLTRIC